MPDTTPISIAQATKAAAWMNANFLTEMEAAVAGSPFTVNHLIAIACQESAYVWAVEDSTTGKAWIDIYPPSAILGRLILDASGDVSGTRTAFPRNTADFISRYGQTLANSLEAEANLTRHWRSATWTDKQWVYAGYGLWQFDLQNIQPSPDGYGDRDFFANKKWYSFAECAKRLMEELMTKYTITKDVWQSIRAYNGGGAAAMQYAENVQTFMNSFA